MSGHWVYLLIASSLFSLNDALTKKNLQQKRMLSLNFRHNHIMNDLLAIRMYFYKSKLIQLCALPHRPQATSGGTVDIRMMAT